jgi:hypothetical protein
VVVSKRLYEVSYLVEIYHDDEDGHGVLVVIVVGGVVY